MEAECCVCLQNVDPRMTEKSCQKLMERFGKVLSFRKLDDSTYTFDFAARDMAAKAITGLNGKKALDKILKVTWASEFLAPSCEEKIAAIESKLHELEKGSEKPATATKRTGAPVWNGAGITRTALSPSLVITNIPPGRLQEVGALFEKDPGFFDFRPCTNAAFVDFESPADALHAMIRMQHFKFPDCGGRGLAIDFDREKRNRAEEHLKKMRRVGGRS